MTVPAVVAKEKAREVAARPQRMRTVPTVVEKVKAKGSSPENGSIGEE